MPGRDVRSGFVALVVDILQPLGGVSARRMFGGYGIFRDGLMFALVVDDRLYLKSDRASRTRFEARGLEPFVYHRQGRPTVMGYHQAPDEGFDDPEILLEWAGEALAAARRQRRAKASRRATGG